jgi:gluconolactonase
MRIAGAPPSDAFNNQGNDFGIIEGPVWREAALYFSEFGSGATPNSRILRVTGDGQVTIAIADAGTNGLALDNAGQLLGANHELGAITRISLPGGASTSLVTEFMGERFNSPNDIAVRKDGNLYFTDPGYQAPSPQPQSATRVYRVAPSATTATAVVEGRQNPNGIALSPDGNTLYVGASDGVFSYPVMADGAVGSGTRLTGTSTDGMAVDCAGNLYLTSNAEIVAVSPAGMELGRFTVSGIQSVTNVAFGGPERKTLYITSLGSGTQRGLFRVDVANPGFPY